ncbi:hypothetical protein CANCADRAFT_44379 [Tortispora caseinolytica NRRL Y-17796]|uniref:Transcription activator GCR1-like domain-containing protein n=1 Tax=Tortispora caseinolytica NRRL Y-17796 TaxID=767744 RepID=A0A1E4TG58_9ASCO|nr:hypothetical protein CANCADRAFT_44379 [Tortispora caseinolytica NRRL Y-17796]
MNTCLAEVCENKDSNYLQKLRQIVEVFDYLRMVLLQDAPVIWNEYPNIRSTWHMWQLDAFSHPDYLEYASTQKRICAEFQQGIYQHGNSEDETAQDVLRPGRSLQRSIVNIRSDIAQVLEKLDNSRNSSSLMAEGFLRLGSQMDSLGSKMDSLGQEIKTQFRRVTQPIRVTIEHSDDEQDDPRRRQMQFTLPTATTVSRAQPRPQPQAEQGQPPEPAIPPVSFIRAPKSVRVIWEEYVTTPRTRPSIKDLERLYGANWRDGAASAKSKAFTRRNHVYKAVETGLQRGMSLETCFTLLENHRIKDGKKRGFASSLFAGDIPEELL